jgi:hypothetical protein
MAGVGKNPPTSPDNVYRVTTTGGIMLARMETLYLKLLRGFILFAATLALLAGVIALATMVPTLLTRMGIIESEGQSHSLADFVAEQKPYEGSAEDEEANTQTLIDPNIKEAAANFKQYIGSPSKATLTDWETGLTELSEKELPIEHRSTYGESIKNLSVEVKESKGKPLTESRVLQLVQWHHQRFAANIAQQASERAQAEGAFQMQMAAAFGAVMLFVFITFIFLFVRIERHLRRVEVAA